MRNASLRLLFVLAGLLGSVAALADQGRPPSSVAPDDGTVASTYGPFIYDPSGNIAAIGSTPGSYYVYDPMSRVVATGVQRGTAVQTQSYSYDAYGNRLSVGGAGGGTYTVDAATNRLTSQSAQYDAAGNLIRWYPPGSATPREYTYDAVGMLIHEDTGSGPRSVLHIYTADDERYWSLETKVDSTNVSHYTLRDLDGKVLRDFLEDGSGFSVRNDYVYRDSLILASLKASATHHYSLDHLGTPRVVTDQNRYQLAEHTYYPFGQEITDGSSTDGLLKFTGHERDEDLANAVGGQLDYMHARYYAPALGRFTSADAGDEWDPVEPQTWNLYTYAGNNPIAFVDVTGEEKGGVLIRMVSGFWRWATRREALRKAKSGAEHGVIIVGPGAAKKSRKLVKDTRMGKRKKHHKAHPGGPPKGPEKHRDHSQYLDADGGQINYELGKDIFSMLPYVGWLVADSVDANADTDMEAIRANFDVIAQEMFEKDFEELTPEEKQQVLDEMLHPDNLPEDEEEPKDDEKQKQ